MNPRLFTQKYKLETGAYKYVLHPRPLLPVKPYEGIWT